MNQAEQMAAEVRAGRAELLVGICGECLYWFPVDDIYESCPNDTIERRHDVNYYSLCGVKREPS